MTGILPSGKLSDMMPRTLPIVLIAAACGVSLLANAETASEPVFQTSATIILHEGVLETKPGEVPLDRDLCNRNTIGQVHVVNDRVFICRKNG